MKRELKLNANQFCYSTFDMEIYRVGKDKIYIFPQIEDFLKESTCLKLTSLVTSQILLPKYAVYQEGKYSGFAVRWRNGDWISSFGGQGQHLKASLQKMKEELLYLSSLGYDMVDMPFYCSHSNGRELTFDGVYVIEESSLELEKLKQKNLELFEEYLKDLVYNGMSEFGTEAEVVVKYLYEDKTPIYDRLLGALEDHKMAGSSIKEKIMRKC